MVLLSLIINAIERASSPGMEYAEIRFHPGGSATLAMGSKNQGQGHETSFRQIVNDRLGLDPKDVAYVDGDTEKVAFGVGTMGSRSMAIGGTALVIASDKIIAKGKKIEAHLMEAAEPDVEFGAGKFKVAGTVGALPAVMNAIMEALAPLGVKEFDMPATGDRVWRVIRQARTMRQ